MERLDTETTSSPNDDEVICRQCRLAAQIELVEDQVHSIACPSCGVSLEGDAAVQAISGLALHSFASEFQDGIERSVRGSKVVTVERSRIKSPGGPFVIGKPKR